MCPCFVHLYLEVRATATGLRDERVCYCGKRKARATGCGHEARLLSGTISIESVA